MDLVRARLAKEATWYVGYRHPTHKKSINAGEQRCDPHDWPPLYTTTSTFGQELLNDYLGTCKLCSGELVKYAVYSERQPTLDRLDN